MRKIILLLLVSVLYILPAQASDGWRVAILRNTTNTDYSTVNASVIIVSESLPYTEIAVPFSALYPNSFIVDAIISPDMRYLVLSQYSNDTSVLQPLLIVDLVTNTCCVQVAVNQSIGAFDLGDFSPDGTLFTTSYVGYTDADATPFGGIISVDVLTGMVANSIEQPTINDSLGVVNGLPWSYLNAWGNLGQYFTPNCYGCDGIRSGEWSILDPYTNTIYPHSGVYFDVFANPQRLANGETIYLSVDAHYPSSGTEAAYVPPANVVHYNAGATPISYDNPTADPVVYFSPLNNDLSSATWVSNGLYWVAVQDTQRAQLVGRAGERVDLDDAYTSDVLVGTPSGWIASVNTPGGAQVVQFIATTSVERYPLTSFNDHDNLRVLRAPILGDAGQLPVTPPSYAPPLGFTPPPTVSASVTCVGFLPSRLVVGQMGRVTPGQANNLRANPTVSATKLGEIPANATFTVLAGPTCDGDGRAWWQVNYSGGIGWTVEGQGNDYWTEPVNP